jgi:acyl-coenzyme A thioesterase PaaI-like protein
VPEASGDTADGQWPADDGRALNRLFGVVASRAANGRGQCDVHATSGEAAPTTFALTTAVDITLVRAAATTVQPPEQMNGTAELNVTYLRQPAGTAHVECVVTGRSPSARLVDFTVSDAEGELARGRSTYAVTTRRSQ